MEDNLGKYWVQWFVRKIEDSLESFGFEIVTKANRIYQAGVCAMPLTWFQDQMKNRHALHLLRTKRHRPEDPDELVEFIQHLEKFISLISSDKEEN